MKKTEIPGEATNAVQPVLDQKPGNNNLQVTQDSQVVKSKLGEILLSLQNKAIIENQKVVLGYLDKLKQYLNGEKKFFLVQRAESPLDMAPFSIRLLQHQNGKVSHDGEDLHTAVQSLPCIHTPIDDIAKLEKLSNYHFCEDNEEVNVLLPLLEELALYPVDERMSVVEKTVAKIHRMAGVKNPKEEVRVFYK